MNKKLLWLATSLAVLVIAGLCISFLIPPATSVPLTSSIKTGLTFTRTVYDRVQAAKLAEVRETLVFAGPLFRPENTPMNLVEMNPALEVTGARKLNDNYFYAAASTAPGKLNFMGGGCAVPSGAWATCSVLTALTPESEEPFTASTELSLDFHEYELDGQGGYWAIKYVSIPCEESTKNCNNDASGNPVTAIGDCNIVHVVKGKISSVWSSNEHLPDGESTSSRYGEFSDVYHCNSIETLTVDGKVKLLVSMRNTDSIYLIDASSGAVEWKLGGKNWGGVSLALSNPGTLGITPEANPEQILSGQHDARYWGNGVFSVFDNGSATGRPARGIVFSVDEASLQATITQVFTDPEGRPSGCTGSFRQMDAGKYWVAGWGCSQSGVTVFDEHTTPIVSTRLDQDSAENKALTSDRIAPLRWTLSYRVIVE